MRHDEMIKRMDEIADRQLELFRRLDDPAVEAELSELDAEAAQLKDLIDAEIERQAASPDARLIDAATRSDWAGVQAALAAGAEVNHADQDGVTALMRAAFHGHTEIAQALLAAEAEVNQADKGGDTALIWAAFHGHTETVQAMLAAGAEVNHADKGGDTAMMWAARQGHTETVQALLSAGAEGADDARA